MNRKPIKSMKFLCESREYVTYFFDKIEPGDLIKFDHSRYDISGYDHGPNTYSVTLIKLTLKERIKRFFNLPLWRTIR